MKSKITLLFLILLFSKLLFSQDMVRVNVNSNPSGANFVIAGGNDVMTTPASLRFSKSLAYQITFTKTGYKSKTISYKGGSGDINVILEQEIKSPPQEDMVRVNVNSNPSGANFVIAGGNDVMKTPASMRFSRSLAYQITFTKPGYNSKTISYTGGSGDIFVNLEQDNISYSLSVKSNVNGAVVFINGQQYGNTPLSTSLTQGNYNISVKANGYKDFNTSINLNSNQNIFANLELNQCSLTINSNIQGANVYLNGQQSGNIPYNVSLNPGNYNIQVKFQGYKTFSTSINLTGNQNIFANLEIERFINIKVPFGARIYINNHLQKTDWGTRNGRDNHDNDKWKTFTFNGDSNNTRYNIRIEYFELTIEKNIEFNGSTLTLFADLR